MDNHDKELLLKALIDKGVANGKINSSEIDAVIVEADVDMEKMENTIISVGGRHDPCIVPRVLPCMEAAMAVALYDALLEARAGGLK